MFSCYSCHVLIKLKSFKNPQIPNFMKNRPLVAELFYAGRHTEEQTNMKKRRVVFRNFWNAPRNGQIFEQYFILGHDV
jgi:hypothetical protein